MPSNQPQLHAQPLPQSPVAMRAAVSLVTMPPVPHWVPAGQPCTKTHHVFNSCVVNISLPCTAYDVMFGIPPLWCQYWVPHHCWYPALLQNPFAITVQCTCLGGCMLHCSWHMCIEALRAPTCCAGVCCEAGNVLNLVDGGGSGIQLQHHPADQQCSVLISTRQAAKTHSILPYLAGQTCSCWPKDWYAWEAMSSIAVMIGT